MLSGLSEPELGFHQILGPWISGLSNLWSIRRISSLFLESFIVIANNNKLLSALVVVKQPSKFGVYVVLTMETLSIIIHHHSHPHYY